jgi:hypothetical protein
MKSGNYRPAENRFIGRIIRQSKRHWDRGPFPGLGQSLQNKVPLAICQTMLQNQFHIFRTKISTSSISYLLNITVQDLVSYLDITTQK